ncbi:hypothetical protein [Mesorhizobium sp. WSM3882]|uniref:hypothetical protein n=1 Tax=Mesorhizobium sp. WSM3882 TaxID=2029407 RepID=UPI000BAFA4D0|nr:hypothetical protein [Mesorhizobium sp. WSM3882]PBB29770.1 hypothetical protein CK214_23645 [Mesorhizobium sp. WSM3882]
MRHFRTRRYGPFEDTRRKRLALARKQRLEREKLPLFSEMIAEEQPDADTVMAQRAEQAVIWEQNTRGRRAANWRRARSRLFAYGDNIRKILRALWNSAPYPGTPEYFADMLHSYDVGRLDPENPPWVYRGPGVKGFDPLPIINRSRERMGLPPLSSLAELPRYGNG